MSYTDKDGYEVNVDDYVEIPNFPEHADKYYQIVAIHNMGDMYELTEIDGYDEEYVDKDVTILVEPWKVVLI